MRRSSSSAGGQLEQPCDVKSSTTTARLPISGTDARSMANTAATTIAKRTIGKTRLIELESPEIVSGSKSRSKSKKLESRSKTTMRLITRSDFDGLVCAVLLRNVEEIDSV